MKKTYIQPKVEAYKMVVNQMLMLSYTINGNYSEEDVEDL